MKSHSYASPATVVNVMYQKYVNTVSLYRYEADCENLALSLKRQTMSNWILESLPESAITFN